MHIPDGFINGTTSLGGGLVAAGSLGVALRQSKASLRHKQIPLAGLAAAFVFAVQMLNFPVAAGFSGHLLGGALVAILLGPAMGAVVVSVVIVVQALLFADGGVSAIGLNVLNMAVLTALVGWAAFRLLVRVRRATRTAWVGAALISGMVSVIVSATGFVLEYAFGGTVDVDLHAVFVAMVGTHALIGIGEGLITAVALGAVWSVRPDLVLATADLRPEERPSMLLTRRSVGWFVAAGLLVTVLLVLVVAPLASSLPDALNRVAIDQGFAGAERANPVDSPVAGYGVEGLEGDLWSTALAGAVGVAATFLLGLLVLRVVRRRVESHDT
ncbi:MAG TPA: energy-coupling factor ABC transporter permease [Acidimicrobiia bacterium]|nr:energy-coupling factor ABC transporter permease [Acidimicrobiia bacterium]